MDAAFGLVGCVGGAMFYFMGKREEREADFLESATRVDRLMDLGRRKGSSIVNTQLLNDGRKRRGLPLVVSVSGRVGSDSPMNCAYSGLRCVLVKKEAEQQFLTYINKGLWKKESVLLYSTSKEVPWYLDDSTGRIRVVEACNAECLSLTKGGAVFEKSDQAPMCGTKDDQGIKLLGVSTVEYVLPIGTRVTVVGKVVRDNTGSILIQSPRHVSRRNIDQLIADSASTSRLFEYFSLGFTVVGACLLAKRAIL